MKIREIAIVAALGAYAAAAIAQVPTNKLENSDIRASRVITLSGGQNNNPFLIHSSELSEVVILVKNGNQVKVADTPFVKKSNEKGAAEYLLPLDGRPIRFSGTVFLYFQNPKTAIVDYVVLDRRAPQ